MALEHLEHHLYLQAILLQWSWQGILGEYLRGALPSLVYIMS